MKKLTVLFSIALVVVFFAACGSDKKDGDAAKKEVVKTPEDEAKEMMAKTKEFTKLISDAVVDNVITDEEAEKIKKFGDDFETYQAKLEEKYPEDSEGKAKIDAYLEKNKAEMEEIYGELMNASMAVSMCEGAEKLQ